MDRISEFQGAHRFLSNFWPAPVEMDDEIYPSVEHAYQAAKTLDHQARAVITAGTAGEAKRASRYFVLRSDWSGVREEIMLRLVRQKFSHLALKVKLLATGDAELVEGNRWGDDFWGVDLRTGKGENRLGKILMQVRSELGADARFERWQRRDLEETEQGG